jgi:hypothetical protein
MHNHDQHYFEDNSLELFDWTDAESTSKHLADAKSKPELDRQV